MRIQAENSGGITLQQVLVGPSEKRAVDPHSPNPARWPALEVETRRRVVAALDNTTGEQVFIPADRLRANIPDFPHGPADSIAIDLAQAANDPSEAMSRARAVAGIDTKQIFRQRGGTGEKTWYHNTEDGFRQRGATGAQLPKEGGFGSSYEAEKVAQIRRERRRHREG